MTDDPTRPDDEIVSAVLDGEATPEERARVEADPVLAERLAEFAAVRALVAGPVTPVTDAERDAAIARALSTATVTETEDATVLGIDRGHTRRRGINQRVLFAAAAVVAVLALAGGLVRLTGDDGGSTDQLASEGGRADTDESTADAGALEVPELALGAIDDPETLVRRVAEDTGLAGTTGESSAFAEDAEAPPVVADAEPAEEAPTTRNGAGGDGEAGGSAEGGGARTLEDCTIDLIESRPSLIGQLAQGTVTYRGTPAFVFVYNDADLGGALTLVTSVTDCTVLAEVPL